MMKLLFSRFSTPALASTLLLSCFFFLSISPVAADAATVTGTVTNKTTNKPAAGDNVVLVAFGQGMQEAGRTQTDARGRFSIEVPDNSMHLLRVDHEKAAYFEPLPPGKTSVDIDVYDVAAKVVGVSTEADVMRVEAGPQGLHVIENYFVKNDSKPPRTQFSAKAYEIYLPPDAKIEAAAAMGPQGMPVASSPMPTGQPGEYAFIFPVRPGETRFQVSYSLSYSGSYKFTPRVFMPVGNFAVILPKSMQFEGSSAFHANDIDATSQAYLAKGVQPSQELAFTVSGTGALPREQQQNGAADAQEAQAGGAGAQTAGPEQEAAASPDNRPGIGLANPIDTPDPLQKYKWWILSGLALVLVIAAAFFLRAKPAAAVAATTMEPQPALVPTPLTSAIAQRGSGGSLLAVLKDELFTLETERLEGKLSEGEYAELKGALEVVLRRALARQAV